MKYSLIENENHTHTLLRHGELVEFNAGRPSNVELEFWQEIQTLKQWIIDLQSGVYINCVYCGHRYGPRETTPATVPEAEKKSELSMADSLKRHIAGCPKHPMSELREERDQLKRQLARCVKYVEQDVQMAADISRHAPLPSEAQMIYDTTEHDSEKLLKELRQLLVKTEEPKT